MTSPKSARGLEHDVRTAGSEVVHTFWSKSGDNFWSKNGSFSPPGLEHFPYPYVGKTLTKQSSQKRPRNQKRVAQKWCQKVWTRSGRCFLIQNAWIFLGKTWFFWTTFKRMTNPPPRWGPKNSKERIHFFTKMDEKIAAKMATKMKQKGAPRALDWLWKWSRLEHASGLAYPQA